MIKHEEVRDMIKKVYANNNRYLNNFTKYRFLYYIDEQQKKDALIDKLYKEEWSKPLKKNGKRGYTNSTRLRLLKQIKALEEELK